MRACFWEHALYYNWIQNIIDCAIARKKNIYYNRFKIDLINIELEEGEKEYENY